MPATKTSLQLPKIRSEDSCIVFLADCRAQQKIAYVAYTADSMLAGLQTLDSIRVKVSIARRRAKAACLPNVVSIYNMTIASPGSSTAEPAEKRQKYYLAAPAPCITTRLELWHA